MVNGSRIRRNGAFFVVVVMRCISNHSKNTSKVRLPRRRWTKCTKRKKMRRRRRRTTIYICSMCSAFERSKPQFFINTRILYARRARSRSRIGKGDCVWSYRVKWSEVLLWAIQKWVFRRIHTCVKFWTFSVGETVFIVGIGIVVANAVVVVSGDFDDAGSSAVAASTNWADSYESLSLLFIAATDGVSADVVNLATAVAISVDDAESLIIIFWTISLLCLSLADSVLLSLNWIKSTGTCCWDDIFDEFLSFSVSRSQGWHSIDQSVRFL